MKRFACPSCGAEVAFKSNVSVYAVCPYCESMLVRTDVDVEAIGKMAALPEDMSPLQIGTEGRFEGEHFGIIGRLKVGWRDGMWNEWHVLTDSGRRGWIGEAQGSFAVSFDVEGGLPTAPAKSSPGAAPHGGGGAPGGGQLEPGSRSCLTAYLAAGGRRQGRDLSRQRRRIALRRAERPAHASIDFVGREGQFATVEIEGETYRAFSGAYVDFDAFRFANLRPLEGWS